MMTNAQFTLPCPKCHQLRTYRTKSSLEYAIYKKSICKKCAYKTGKCYRHGTIIPNVIKEKMRNAKLGRKLTVKHKCNISKAIHRRYLSSTERQRTSELTKNAMHRPEVRRRHIEGLHHSKWLKVRTDKRQLEVLEKWNRLGFRFEPNYQVYTNNDLFYVDGYDATHGVIIEYDSKYHEKYYQKQKDILRQQKIISILHPKKFWRYNSVNHQWKNVIGE